MMILQSVQSHIVVNQYGPGEISSH